MERRKFFTYSILILAVLGAVFFTYIFLTEFPLRRGFRFVMHQGRILAGQREDRVNLLILGMGGAGHEGPYLTDTIILASFKPSTKEAALLSIPRDLYVPVPDYGWSKINRINSLAEEQTPGSGVQAALTGQIVSYVFDLPVHYWVLLDFAGFEEIIDQLGGVDIYVERTFVDNEYPTSDFEYQTVFFKKGWQNMSGVRALQFARSRHGSSGEGSDFARCRRQQKVITAVFRKAISLKLLAQPRKICSILKNLEKSVKTNLGEVELVRLARLVQNIEEKKIINRVIDGQPDGLLVEGWASDGSYVLKTKSGGFEELRALAKNIFMNSNQ